LAALPNRYEQVLRISSPFAHKSTASGGEFNLYREGAFDITLAYSDKRGKEQNMKNGFLGRQNHFNRGSPPRLDEPNGIDAQ